MPELIYDIKFKVNQIDKIAGADKVNDQIKDLGNNLEDAEQKTKGLSKSLAISNQALFSFSDLVQDSAQFGQGFEQGMRAIGNNVGFTAELLGNLNTKVKTHNDGLSDLEKQQGKSTSVLKELQRSFLGVGGVILTINAAVLAAQFLFRRIDNEIKEITASARSQAEALGDVAKAFAELDTGVPDPFGLRARALEIEVLSEQFEDISRDDAIKRAFEELSDPITSFLIPFKGAVLEIGTFFGKFDESIISTIEKNDNLRKQVKELTTTQQGYISTLQTQNPVLAEYVRLTADLEQLLVEQATGVELTDATFVSLSISIQDQISILEDLEVRTLREASMLTKLGQLLEMVTQKTEENNEANTERIEGLSKAFKFTEQARLSAEENIKILTKRLDVVKTVDKQERIIAEGELERLKINIDANKRIAEVKKRFTDLGLTNEEAAAKAAEAITQINNEKELQIQISNQNQSLELQKHANDEKLNEEKEHLAALAQLRDDASAEFRAKQAENELALLQLKKFSNGKLIKLFRDNIQLEQKDEIANNEFKAKLIEIAADKTLSTAEEEAAIRQAQADLDISLLNNQMSASQEAQRNIADTLDLGMQAVSSFKSLKDQEIDAEIQAAKARGASAKEIEKLERKKFEANKKAQLANAIINTAANVVEAKPPSAKAIATAAIGALQIATILKTKFGGGSSGSSGVSASGSSGSGASGIISSRESDRSVQFLPARGGEFNGREITIINTFDEEKVSEVAERGSRKRQMQQVAVA